MAKPTKRTCLSMFVAVCWSNEPLVKMIYNIEKCLKQAKTAQKQSIWNAWSDINAKTSAVQSILLTVLDSLRTNGLECTLYNSNEAIQICPHPSPVPLSTTKWHLHTEAMTQCTSYHKHNARHLSAMATVPPCWDTGVNTFG